MEQNNRQNTAFAKVEQARQLGNVHHADLAVIENLMAGGIITSAQHAAPTTSWSPEKKLAGAVLASALVEVRDHAGNPSYRRRLEQDLEWIRSDDAEWPFSFLRLCALFDLDPGWVRGIVEVWAKTTKRPGSRPASAYRHAA